MGIVVITIPGEAKRDFVNSLHKITGNQVELVIIQKQRPNHSSLFNRLKRLYRSVGLGSLIKELWYAVLLRIDEGAKQALEYFRIRSGSHHIKNDFVPPVFETYSANSDEIFNKLKDISPKLIVIWGSTIIKPHILKTAPRAINLHMGLCPYYRGAIANQHAVMNKHFNKIGATIHDAVEEVDSGNILETISVNSALPPQELFRELNDKAEERFLDIASRIYKGEELIGAPQDTSRSEKMLLKDWTPSRRYQLARQMLEWERESPLEGTPLQKADYRL
jgi:folate-dependent phosphoribosylglycinamide formyltransferase PurN